MRRTYACVIRNGACSERTSERRPGSCSSFGVRAHVRRSSGWWTLPNVLSAARFPLALAFPIALRRRRDDVAVGIVLTAALTDVVDGFVARRRGQSSALGAVIDGLADKAFGLSVLGALVVDRRLSPASAMVLALRELGELPLAVRVVTERGVGIVDVERRANVLGKCATTLELATVVGVLLRVRGRRGLLAATGVVGALAAISYWMREGQVLSRPGPRSDFRRTTRS